MDHKLLEAKATTTTDLGEFEAIAAAYSVDRGKERIIPGAFAKTIEAWQASGKQIPLHWDHSGDPEDIIGTVDPSAMKETEDGLYVKGKLDLEDSPVAKAAWRSIKANRVGLSFGYLTTSEAEGEDGIRELKSVDLFEITVTPTPMNPDTRFIGLKSVKEMSHEELVAEFKATRRRIEELAKALEVEAEAEAETPQEATVEVEELATRSPEDQVAGQDPPISALAAQILRERVRART